MKQPFLNTIWSIDSICMCLDIQSCHVQAHLFYYTLNKLACEMLAHAKIAKEDTFSLLFLWGIPHPEQSSSTSLSMK